MTGEEDASQRKTLFDDDKYLRKVADEAGVAAFNQLPQNIDVYSDLS